MHKPSSAGHALRPRDQATALRSPASVLVGAPLHEVRVRARVVRPALALEEVLHIGVPGGLDKLPLPCYWPQGHQPLSEAVDQCLPVFADSCSWICDYMHVGTQQALCGMHDEGMAFHACDKQPPLTHSIQSHSQLAVPALQPCARRS